MPLTPRKKAKRNMQTWVNGKLQTKLSVKDRGVQYGDGFFTTMLVMQDTLYNWSAHWWRLQESAARLGFPALEESIIRAEIQAVLDEFIELQSIQKHPNIQHENQQACLNPLAVKLIITRGEGGKGYQAPLSVNPTRIIQITGHPSFEQAVDFSVFQAPIELGVCQTLCAIQPQLAGLKHLNRLENVLARNELLVSNVTEAIMLNAHSEMVCATQANLFLIKGQQLMTPLLVNSGVAGTTRYQMPKIAQVCGLDYHEQTLTLEDLQSADELFLTNALRGIMPIKSFQTKHYPSEQTHLLHQAWVFWQQKNGLALNIKREQSRNV